MRKALARKVKRLYTSTCEKTAMSWEYQQGSQKAYDFQYHNVWANKYHYKILTGEVAHHIRELIIK